MMKSSKSKFWLMRQAGRYMPEYMKIRKNFNNFISMCLNEKAVHEITMQPINKFNIQSAIIFSDILLLFDTLGAKVDFKEGVGPIIENIDHRDLIERDYPVDKLQALFKAIKMVRKDLSPEKPLIGFSGSPWTMLSYYISQKSPGNCLKAKKFIYEKPQEFQEMMKFITKMIILHLKEQVKSGVDIIKLFDSNAGFLSCSEFNDFVIEPTKIIVQSLKQSYPELEIMGFPKGAGVLYESYAKETGVDIMTIDYSVPLDWAKEKLQPHVILQGNLNPFTLAYDLKKSLEEAEKIIKVLNNDNRFIFNLGHGVIPETPTENVNELIALVRNNL